MSRLFQKEQSSDEPVEQVTFWAWNETEPSSMFICISGGEKRMDQGKIFVEPLKKAQFVKGLFRTDDPQTIAVLRKLISQGDTISEDKEVYLAHVEKPELRAKRLLAKAETADKTVKAQGEEIERLKALLANQPRLGKKQAAGTVPTETVPTEA